MRARAVALCLLAGIVGYVLAFIGFAYWESVQRDLRILGTIQHCQQMPDECDGSDRRQE